MVNVNKHKDPCVYALVDDAGVPFYIGRTGTNAQNRLWEHNYRANSGHNAPVYRKMREVGVGNVSFIILERGEANQKEVEAKHIKEMLDNGVDLTNTWGRDGTPDSWTDEHRQRLSESRRGVPTWIKGKTGPEAGWTEARRKQQSLTLNLKKWKHEVDNPRLLFDRMDAEELKLIRKIRDALDRTQITPKPRSSKSTARHGTRTMWEKYKCKCTPCRDAGARHNAKKRGKLNWETVTAGRTSGPNGKVE